MKKTIKIWEEINEVVNKYRIKYRLKMMINTKSLFIDVTN